MKVVFSSPVRGLEGKTKQGELVYYMNQDVALVRQVTKPVKRVPSEEQAKMRLFIVRSSQHWSSLTVAQRESWEAYASLHFRRNAQGKEVFPSGIAAYNSASSIRQILGLPLTEFAPAEDPPQAILEVHQSGPADSNSVRLTLHHGIDQTAGLQALVRITPATATVARKPRPGDYRLVQGIGAESAVALPASGGTIEFSAARFAINSGQRYGVEVRVIRTADGTASKAVYGDFVKVG